MYRKQLTVIVLLTVGGSVAVAQHNPPNGDFESSVRLENWTTNGDVEQVTNSTTNNKFVLMQEGAMAGSRSSIHRLENIPANPTWLSFRYGFVSSSIPRTSNVPPDSFLFYIVNPGDGSRSSPLAGSSGFLPETEAMFYQDSDGVLLHDDRISIVPAQLQGDFNQAIMDISGFTAEEQDRFEFGLAGGSNGIETSVFVDDFTFGCPPGFCCDAGQYEPIDDGDVCTLDECGSGSVSHTTIDCCRGCAESDNSTVSIVFMVDLSASISAEDYDKMRDSITDLLNYLEPIPGKPRIAFGIFAVRSVIPSGAGIFQGLTTNYDSVRSIMSSVATIVDGMSGGTTLAAGIDAAHAELHNNAPNDRKIMILLTDGWTNIPGAEPGGSCPGTSSTNCCGTSPTPDPCCDTTCDCHCACSEARTAAETESNEAKQQDDVEIYTAHFVGTGAGDCATITEVDYVADAVNWLTNNIASSTEHFIENPDTVDFNGELGCEFVELIEVVSCDDGIACTVDSCNGGQCSHDSASCP